MIGKARIRIQGFLPKFVLFLLQKKLHEKPEYVKFCMTVSMVKACGWWVFMPCSHSLSNTFYDYDFMIFVCMHFML